MTANDLQACLIKEIELLTNDMSLIDKHGRAVKMKGFQQGIPIVPVFGMEYKGGMDEGQEGKEDDLFPYFIVRINDISYQQKETDFRNAVSISIIFAVYDDDPKLKGYFTLSAILERVVMRFQRDVVLESFYCEKGMDVAFQEDDTIPYFFGGIEMTWYIPDIEMEEIY